MKPQKKIYGLTTLVVIMLLSLVAFKSTTMKQKIRMNHLAIYVQDLQKSTAFYRDIIGLDTIPEPFHDGRHTWFSIGEMNQLHVISGATAPLPHDKNNHLCFSVQNINDFISTLNKNSIEYENWAGEKKAITLRVDGVKQIWLRDLDGYWIEINDAN